MRLFFLAFLLVFADMVSSLVNYLTIGPYAEGSPIISQYGISGYCFEFLIAIVWLVLGFRFSGNLPWFFDPLFFLCVRHGVGFFGNLLRGLAPESFFYFKTSIKLALSAFFLIYLLSVILSIVVEMKRKGRGGYG